MTRLRARHGSQGYILWTQGPRQDNTVVPASSQSRLPTPLKETSHLTPGMEDVPFERQGLQPSEDKLHTALPQGFTMCCPVQCPQAGTDSWREQCGGAMGDIRWTALC